MPPQSANGMGGKGTSKRAQAASRVTLGESAHPNLASPQSLRTDAPTSVRHQSVAYAYAIWFVVAAAFTLYVFLLSN